MITIICKTETVAKRMREILSEFGNSVECVAEKDAPAGGRKAPVITSKDVEWYESVISREYEGSSYLTDFLRSILCKHRV